MKNLNNSMLGSVALLILFLVLWHCLLYTSPSPRDS